MLTRCTSGLRGRMNSDASGFSLIEVVVSMVVLMLFAGALIVTLTNGLSVSKASRQRVAAANLAARELEIVRNTFSSSDAKALAVAATSSVTNGNPLTVPGDSVVDGVPYTVRRDVQWLPTGTGVSACDGGSLVNSPSLKVSVTVIWPNMRTARPVRAETVMTPLKGTLDNLSTAFIAAKVQNAAGGASAGVTAKATGPGGTFTHTTDASGCAVFQVGTAGSYSVTLDMSGWVDQTGTQVSVKTPIVVAAGTLVKVPMTYDLFASMDVTLATDSGYVLPTPLPAVSYLKPNPPLATVRVIATSVSTTTRVASLWPTTDGYAAWPGGCADSDPAGVPTGGTRGAPVVVSPGGVGVATARLAPIDLTVLTSVATGSVKIPGVVVTATSVATSPACSTYDKSLTLGTTGIGVDAGKLKTSLPYGKWVLNTTYQIAPPGPGSASAAPDPVTPSAAGVTAEDFVVN